MTIDNDNEVMGLREYINVNFDGCQASFAKSCGKSPKHIWRQLQSCDYLVVNNNVVQIKYQCKPINAEKPQNDS